MDAALLWCELDLQKVCFLINLQETTSFLYNYNRRFELALELKRQLEERTGERISMGVSPAYYEPDELEQRYREAERALEYMAFAGREKIVFFETIRAGRELNILGQLQESVALRKKKRALEKIAELYDKNIQGMQQYHYLEYVNSLLFGYLTFLTTRYHIPWEEFCEDGKFSITALNSMGSCREMKELVQRKLRFVMEYLEEEEGYSDIVKNALRFVNEHYQEDISRESIADEIGVHRSYLSKLFKQETGKSLNTYLNETRIQKAVALMEAGKLRTMDIVYSVGYNSTQNFYHAFRQVMGMTPKEYREQKNRD